MPRPAAVVIKTLQQEKEEEEERPGDMGHCIVRQRLATQFRRKLPYEILCADLRCDIYANVALSLARLTVLWERKGSRRWLEYGAGDWLSNPSTCTSSPSTEKPAASLGEEVGLPPSLLLCCAQTIFASLSKYMVAS